MVEILGILPFSSHDVFSFSIYDKLSNGGIYESVRYEPMWVESHSLSFRSYWDNTGISLKQIRMERNPILSSLLFCFFPQKMENSMLNDSYPYLQQITSMPNLIHYTTRRFNKVLIMLFIFILLIGYVE